MKNIIAVPILSLPFRELNPSMLGALLVSLPRSEA